MLTLFNFGSLDLIVVANLIINCSSLPEIIRDISLKNGGSFFSFLKKSSFFKKTCGSFLDIFKSTSSSGVYV